MSSPLESKLAGDIFGSFSEAYDLAAMQEFKKSNKYVEGLNDYPWTLEEGLKVIRDLQEHAYSCGYFLCLSGGVLNKGISYNDLDIIAIPGPNESYLNEFSLDLKLRTHLSLTYREGESKSIKHLDIRRLKERERPHRKVDLIFVKRPEPMTIQVIQ